MPNDEALFQVTVTVPASKLGGLLSTLPPKLNPQIARLEQREPGVPRGKWKKTRDANGQYQPAPGTTGAALFKLLKKTPLRPAEMKAKLPKHAPAAVSSALGRLLHFKVAKRNADGSYGA